MNYGKNQILHLIFSGEKENCTHPNIFFNEFSRDKLESVQCKAALPITAALQVKSREKLFIELGLEWLASRRWLRRLLHFWNIEKSSTRIFEWPNSKA